MQGANLGNWYFKFDDGSLHHDEEVGSAWVQQYHRMAYEGLRPAAAKDPKEAVPFLTRSAFAGSQRYGAILWSGDIESSFNELATQVQVAQHVAMSGIYLWTTDIGVSNVYCVLVCWCCTIWCFRWCVAGGFRNGNTEDPQFRELIVRWFQFG